MIRIYAYGEVPNSEIFARENLSADVGALCTFSANGKVDVGLGIAAAVFCMIGSYIGSGLVVNNGQKIVRPVVLVVLVLLFAKLLMGA